MKEKRPEGTGIAGFLVLLPKLSKLRFLPSTVTLRGLKFPPASAGALGGQTSPGAEEGTAKQRDKGKNNYHKRTACRSRGVRGGMREGTVIFAGAAASPSLCPSLCPSLPTLSEYFISHQPYASPISARLLPTPWGPQDYGHPGQAGHGAQKLSGFVSTLPPSVGPNTPIPAG